MYSNKEVMESIGAYKGAKKIAAKVCIKLSAPLIRILNQEFSLVRDAVDRHEKMLKGCVQMETRLRAYEGIADAKQLKEYLQSFEEMSDNIRQLNSRLEGYEEQTEILRQLNSRFEEASGNIRQLNSRLEGYEEQAEILRQLNSRFEEASGNIRQLNSRLEGYEHLAEIVRDCKEMMPDLAYRADKIESIADMYAVKIARLEKSGMPAYKEQPYTAEKAKKQEHHAEEKAKKQEHQAAGCNEQDGYSSIDYFDFENHFRGSRNAVKKSQQIYLDYFRDRKHVLDVGCGRGEFLELMKEHGIMGYGVDAYEQFVELCRLKQLDAVHGDAFDILEKERELDGIFAAQFIEHIGFEQLMRLLELAYEKLVPGSYLVLETQNPMSLAIYANGFYIDPSHNKPVHPLTVKYLLEKIGFRDVSVLFTERSKLPFSIPRLQIENAEHMEQFNDAMGEVERMLFGSQDYAVVAKR